MKVEKEAKGSGKENFVSEREKIMCKNPGQPMYRHGHSHVDMDTHTCSVLMAPELTMLRVKVK